jgi:hypothetical protein
MEFSRFFECVFWWVFLLSVDEWAGWVVLLDFRVFVMIFFSWFVRGKFQVASTERPRNPEILKVQVLFSRNFKNLSLSLPSIPSINTNKPNLHKNQNFRPICLSSSVFMKIELMCLAMSRYFGIRSIIIKLRSTFRND